MAEIHATAIIAPGAQLADDVAIGPYSVIGEHVEIGAGTRIGAHAVITGHTRIGQHNHRMSADTCARADFDVIADHRVRPD